MTAHNAILHAHLLSMERLWDAVKPVNRSLLCPERMCATCDDVLPTISAYDEHLRARPACVRSAFRHVTADTDPLTADGIETALGVPGLWYGTGDTGPCLLQCSRCDIPGTVSGICLLCSWRSD